MRIAEDGVVRGAHQRGSGVGRQNAHLTAPHRTTIVTTITTIATITTITTIVTTIASGQGKGVRGGGVSGDVGGGEQRQ